MHCTVTITIPVKKVNKTHNFGYARCAAMKQSKWVPPEDEPYPAPDWLSESEFPPAPAVIPTHEYHPPEPETYPAFVKPLLEESGETLELPEEPDKVKNPGEPPVPEPMPVFKPVPALEEKECAPRPARAGRRHARHPDAFPSLA